MGLIERVWITGGEYGGDKVLYDEASANAWRERTGFPVEGPFVRPSTNQGAVEALEAIVATFEASEGKDVDPFDVSLAMVDSARRALDRSRGAVGNAP